MKEIVLIGSGNMAIAYCEVLKSLNVSFTVVGNSKGKAKEFTDKTGKECISGGIEKYLERIQRLPDYAIVAVQVEALFKVATLLINKKIKLWLAIYH